MTTHPTGGKRINLTPAQRSMLQSHNYVWEKYGETKGVAHTHELGSIRTWHKLYDLGLVKGGRITAAGRAALGAKS